jgi:hypothetical protein
MSISPFIKVRLDRYWISLQYTEHYVTGKTDNRREQATLLVKLFYSCVVCRPGTGIRELLLVSYPNPNVLYYLQFGMK